MQRSPLSWLYWLLFVGCVGLAVLLNLRWPGLPEPDPGALLRDNWFLWGFNYFGLLLMPVAALLIDDARRKNMRWPIYVVPFFVVGILALSVYMARRPANDRVKRDTPLILEQRWVWWLLLIGLVVISIIFLPNGSLAQLIDTMSKNLGLAFMWLDIVLNHIVALPLARADMQRRGIAQQSQTIWLIAILLTGPIALCIYMATRPAATGPATIRE